MKQEKKRGYRTFTAMEKAKAVLSIWSERRRPSDVCRELGLKWAHVNHWQKAALEGMLKSLEPKNSKDKEMKPAIGDRLKKLLEKQKEDQEKTHTKLQQRLEKIQEKKEAASPQ